MYRVSQHTVRSRNKASLQLHRNIINIKTSACLLSHSYFISSASKVERRVSKQYKKYMHSTTIKILHVLSFLIIYKICVISTPRHGKQSIRIIPITLFCYVFICITNYTSSFLCFYAPSHFSLSLFTSKTICALLTISYFRLCNN